MKARSTCIAVVELTPDALTSWGRGFNADGNQVWGPEAGPYVFDRVTRDDAAGAGPTGAP